MSVSVSASEIDGERIRRLIHSYPYKYMGYGLYLKSQRLTYFDIQQKMNAVRECDVFKNPNNFSSNHRGSHIELDSKCDESIVRDYNKYLSSRTEDVL